MLELGYALSSEEFSANELVRLAQRAEQAGFSFVVMSDHYHPWTSKQGQSPFVWSVIGAIAQAAATAAAIMPGRFFLGVGTGENLNEHIYLHQVGKDQEGFFRFYEREILPEFGVKPARARHRNYKEEIATKRHI